MFTTTIDIDETVYVRKFGARTMNGMSWGEKTQKNLRKYIVLRMCPDIYSLSWWIPFKCPKVVPQHCKQRSIIPKKRLFLSRNQSISKLLKSFKPLDCVKSRPKLRPNIVFHTPTHIIIYIMTAICLFFNWAIESFLKSVFIHFLKL